MTGYSRYAFLDAFRGATLLFMLEGHVLRALLEPSARLTEAFRIHEIFHNFTGPAFLLASGFSFAIPVLRHWEENINFSPRLFRRVRRILFVIVLGYVLQLPFFSITKIFTSASEEQLQQLFAFGVLQCIGLSLLLVQFILFATRSEKIFLATSLFTGLTIVLTTPLVWDLKSSGFFPMPLANTLNMEFGSPFPIFPYTAFLIAGVVISWRFLKCSEEANECRFMYLLLGGGLGIAIISLFLDALPFNIYPTYNYWFTSPNFFILRLGILCTSISLFWFVENQFIKKGDIELKSWKWLEAFGKESLLIYIVHLLILHGSAVNNTLNVVTFWGSSFNTIQCITVFIILSAILLPFAILWQFIKKKHPILMRGIISTLIITFVYLFLTNPY